MLLNRRYVPPYRSSLTSTWSPARKSFSSVVIAAMPLENAMAFLPPSSSAMVFSSSRRVGLPQRE